MKRTKIITFEWDTIQQNIYEKTYYYNDEDQFIYSEIIKTYNAKEINTFDQYFRVDQIIENS